LIKLPLNCSFLSAYLLDTSLLVYSEKSKNVYGFEKSDAALFLQIDSLFENGTSKVDILHQFSSLPKDFIETVYTLVSSQEESKKESYSPPIDIGNFLQDDLKRISYVSNQLTFLINYPNEEVYQKIHPAIQHLKNNLLTSNLIAVDFEQHGEKWQILFNNKKIAFPVDLSKLIIVLQENMLIVLYQSQPYLITMHAATIEYNDNLLIFPAVSGSGKTTLTAALMNNDFTVYSDELSVISREGKTITLPFSLNIKEGSWYILEKMYPILKQTSYHIRFDNQKVKFLQPAKLIHKSKQPTHLIFPNYKKDATTKVEELSACDAMNRIKEAGYQLDKPLTENDFEKILNYLLVIPKFSIEYSSLSEAIEAFKRITLAKN